MREEMSSSSPRLLSKPQIAPKPEYDRMVSSLKQRLGVDSAKQPLSLLEEIYAEIEDKHAKSSLLKTINNEYSSYSSSNSSAYSSYSSYSSSSSSGVEPPPPLPNVPPPPLGGASSLQQEIEREICSKLDGPFKLNDEALAESGEVCAPPTIEISVITIELLFWFRSFLFVFLVEAS